MKRWHLTILLTGILIIAQTFDAHSQGGRQSTYEIDVLYLYEGAEMEAIIRITKEGMVEGCRADCLENSNCRAWVYVTEKHPVEALRTFCGNYTAVGLRRAKAPPGSAISGVISEGSPKTKGKKK